MTYSLVNTLVMALGSKGLGIVAKIDETSMFWAAGVDEYRFGTIAGGTIAWSGSLGSFSEDINGWIPVQPGQEFGSEWVGVLTGNRLGGIALNFGGDSVNITPAGTSITDYVESVTSIDTGATVSFSWILSNGVGASLCFGTNSATEESTGTGSHTKSKGYQYLVRWTASGSGVTFSGAQKVSEYWVYTFPPDNDQDTYYKLTGFISFEDMVIWQWHEAGNYGYDEKDKILFGTSGSFGSGQQASYVEDQNYEVSRNAYIKSRQVGTINFLATHKTVTATSERFLLFLGSSTKSVELGLTFPPLNRFAAQIVAFPMGYGKFLVGVAISTSDSSPSNFSAQSYILEYEITPDQTLCIEEIDYGSLGAVAAGNSVNAVFSMDNGTKALLSWRANGGGDNYNLTLFSGLTGIVPTPPLENRLWIFKTENEGNSWSNRGVALLPPDPGDSCIDEEWDG